MSSQDFDHSLSEVHESVDTTTRVPGWRKIFSFLGPAYLVSVGYMDPGNWATDIAGGSKYGFTLIWVLLASNIMAVLLQTLSARLGIVRRRDLAQANRETYPPAINFILWILAEIAIAATDLAEVLGMAIGLQLLFGLPLITGVSITLLDTFLLLYLQKLGMRKMEAFIITLILIIAISFLINIIIAHPDIREVIKGFIPSLPDAGTLYASKGMTAALPSETALYLAIGMIGATVMPHNLYLHSALIQTRKINRDKKGIREALKWSLIDSVIALNVAFFINAGILILAATVFFQTGRTDVGEIRTAHELLSPMLGSSIASTLFAVALIASGQSSTLTGTLSGQIVMEGYLKIRINPMMRRLITRLIAIIPAIIVIFIYGENNVNALLIFSQVVLSIQLGFAIIPLIHFVSEKKSMGEFAIGPIIKILAWLMAFLLVFLNGKMIMEEAISYFVNHQSLLPKILIGLMIVAFVFLLMYVLLYPILSKRRHQSSISLHAVGNLNFTITPPNYKKIAVALDFGKDDMKIIGSAIGQLSTQSQLLIIHVVESASASLHGEHSDDYETAKDREHLNNLIDALKKQGIDAEGILGYQKRSSEIVRIIREQQADLLVIGAHGHSGISDFVYGSTIDTVRHDLDIPVLIVNL